MPVIEKIKGLDKRLYELVAPLVMNPEVLKQNMNYPFKTSAKFVWFVALEDDRVIGFMPVEIRNGDAIINNYYTEKENPDTLNSLIKEASKTYKQKYSIVSITQCSHIPVFIKNKFIIEREWKNYVKMRLIK